MTGSQSLIFSNTLFQFLPESPSKPAEAPPSLQLRQKHCQCRKHQLASPQDPTKVKADLQAFSIECKHLLASASPPARWQGPRTCRECPSTDQLLPPTQAALLKSSWKRAARRRASGRRWRGCKPWNYWTTWSTSSTTLKCIQSLFSRN